MPDSLPVIVLAASGWAVALIMLVTWRRGAAANEARARGDGDEIRRLGVEEARLLQRIDGLEARLGDAATERARIAEAATEERAAIQVRLDAALGDVRRLEISGKGVATELAARIARHDEDVALLRDLRDEMTAKFQVLADATLKDHGERFGTLNRERLDALLKPMRDQVDHFQRELRDAHTGAARDRERLKTEIETLTRRSEQISGEAVALTNALKGEKQRQGAWGEMILERVLEDSGLTPGREYEVQVSVADEEGGRRRPDAVVRLPRDKVVVIDAKVSLNAYEAAVNADAPEDRATHLRAHATAVRRHIDDLRGRDYARLVDGSVDYVLMFMPVEGALAAALEVADDLTSYAIAHRVGIATPTTLMVALRTIQHVWDVERRETNADAIAERAGLMYDKMAGVVEALDKVGAKLDEARGAHVDAVDRLSRGNGNLLNQFDKLKRLGARTRKALPDDFDPDGDGPALIPGAAAE